MDGKNMQIIHNTGKRDALAEIMMLIRMEEGDCIKVILRLAEEMLELEKDHPHAKWIIENYKK